MKCNAVQDNQLGRMEAFRGNPTALLTLSGPFIGDSTMKRISLTQGQYALVDDADYEWLMQWKWRVQKTTATNWYAIRTMGNKQILMHRLILGISNDRQTDHINHNGLDNRRSNIRLCTCQQNQFNQRRQQRETTSEYKGVGWCKRAKKWKSRIKRNSREIHLGYYDSEIAAAKVYDAKAVELFGEFANTNF